MQIPTRFKDEMERKELHSAQLVEVEQSIYRFFSKQENVNNSGQFTKRKLKKKPYQKTVSVVFLPSLF